MLCPIPEEAIPAPRGLNGGSFTMDKKMTIGTKNGGQAGRKGCTNVQQEGKKGFTG